MMQGEYSKTAATGGTKEEAAITRKIFKDPPSMSLHAEEQKRVLILGAGLVAGPAAEYMSRQNHVTVVSGVKDEARQLVRNIG